MLKDHEIAYLVNELTTIAKHYYNHQSLRQRISNIVVATVKKQTKQDKQLLALIDSQYDGDEIIGHRD